MSKMGVSTKMQILEIATHLREKRFPITGRYARINTIVYSPEKATAGCNPAANTHKGDVNVR